MGAVVILSLLSQVLAPPLSNSLCPSFLICTHRRCRLPRAAPCGGQPCQGAPNKFCAPPPQRRCLGGVAMWGQTSRTTFPRTPFIAATLAGGRWLSGVWPFRLPGRSSNPQSWSLSRGPETGSGVRGPGQLLPSFSTPPPLGTRSTCQSARISLLASRWLGAGGPRPWGLPRLLA